MHAVFPHLCDCWLFPHEKTGLRNEDGAMCYYYTLHIRSVDSTLLSLLDMSPSITNVNELHSHYIKGIFVQNT